MNQKTILLSILVAAILIGCNNGQDKKVQINPLDQLKQVDNLLAEISEKLQQLSAPSDKATTVTGAKGTVIHVDPNRLETVDGSPLGDKIQIELLEMTDNSSMLLNNTQTVSNRKILVTGGAYYLNMTSDGKQLKMKQGKGLEVEFPKLTEDEMGLFLGERDSLGQMNWISTNQTFENKKDSSFALLLWGGRDTVLLDSSEALSNNTLEDYYPEFTLAIPTTMNQLSNEQIKRYREALNDTTRQTYRAIYEAVKLMNFGWINCDRFWNDPNPKTDIKLLVNNDSLSGARFYAVFKDINSIMTEYYWKSRTDTAAFRNIPIGKELTIIALSAKDETPYVFEKTINTETDKQVQIEFMATTKADIMEKMKRMN
jgi:hypothetical protein